MATPADAQAACRSGWAPDRLERVLAGGAVVLGVAVVTALVRGRAEWAQVPALIWLHIATILVAVGLTPTMLLSPRGTQRHRWLGRIWVAAMLATAALSLGIHSVTGGWSVIHILSAWTLIQAPLIWWTARTHAVVRHRRAVRGMVIGALLVAGFFTFPFHRLLGGWLFG